MKIEVWTSALLFCLGLHVVRAPATYYIKNLDQNGSYKKPVFLRHSGNAVSSMHQSVYPANTLFVHPERDLTSEFIKEISAIRIPHKELPAQIPVYYDKSHEDIEEEEEEVDEDYDKEADYDKPTIDYDRPSLDYDKPDYTNNDEYSEPINKAPPAFRDYGESDSGVGYQEEMLSKYKVTEKIPDDNKYKPPKVKVVPVPPPCLRPAPPPPPPPKPKPTTGEFWSDPGRPYRIQASPSNRYRHRRIPKMTYMPVLVRHFYPQDGSSDIVIRHHTILPPLPPPPPRKPKIKEVHIHHHHGFPMPGLPVTVHVHKDQHESNSIESEDKRLEMDLNHYNAIESPSGTKPVVSPGHFAEPPLFYNKKIF